jgi:hypothetical protein
MLNLARPVGWAGEGKRALLNGQGSPPTEMFAIGADNRKQSTHWQARRLRQATHQELLIYFYLRGIWFRACMTMEQLDYKTILGKRTPHDHDAPNRRKYWGERCQI